MINTRENPYVGPHAFQLEDQKKFAGRDKDITALYRLVIAERIVLLYSPSGAGKSSLVNAGLKPRMMQRAFIMFPVVRVNLPLPDDLSKNESANRYVMSMLQTLGGAKRGISNQELAALTINEYLTQRVRPGKASDSDDEEPSEPKSFFVFDQFEEILTIDPNDDDGKREFFSQLGEALEESGRWALFVVREDYLAALDPYLRYLPTRLANRYRLDLLDADAAKAAICKPAEVMGVHYEEQAVEHLTRELRSVRVQRQDGSWDPAPQLGRYVEPVQLQVVCHRLWEKINEDDVITEEEVSNLGSVDDSLAEFYREKVEETERQVGVSQKEIRTWFDTALITSNNIRSQIMWEEGKTAGLDNEAIQYLEKTHLIRRESRRGIMWLELAHDRLIIPVRKSNEEWFKGNLSALQKQAMLWAAEKEPERLLLRYEGLKEAEEWVKGKTLSPNEQKFLATSLDLRERVQAATSKKEAEALAERNKLLAEKNSELAEKNKELDESNKHQRTLFIRAIAAAIVAIVLAVIAMFAVRDANIQKNIATDLARDAARSERNADVARGKAEEEAEKAKQAQNIAEYRSLVSNASQLAAQSELLADADTQLAVLLALEALKMTEREHKPPLPVAEEALRTSLGSQRGFLLSGHTSQIQSVAISNDEHWLATADRKGNIRIWDLRAQNLLDSAFSLPRPEEQSITNIVFSPDSSYLVAGGDGGFILIYNLETEQYVFGSMNHIYDEPVTAIALSRDGAWLAVSGFHGTVNLYNLKSVIETQNFEPTRLSSSGILKITVLKFSPDSTKLAAGSQDNLVRIWTVNTPKKSPTFVETNAVISALDFTPDSGYLAIGSHQMIYLWKNNAPSNVYTTYQKSASKITVMAYDPNESAADGSKQQQLFVGHADGSMEIWRGNDNTFVIPTGEDIIRLTDSDITHMSFSPDGQWLLTGSKDGLARLFDLGQINSAPRILHRFGEDITAAVISPEGTWISVSSDSTEAHLWNLKAGLDTVEPLSLDGGPFAFSQAESILITGPQDDQLPALLSWDFDDLDELKKISTEIKSDDPDQLSMFSLAISQDGHWLAGCDTGGNVHIKDMKDKNATVKVLKEGPNDDNESCWKVEFSADARYLIALENSEAKGVIKIWDLLKADFTNTEPQIINPPHAGYLTALAFSLDGNWMATGSDGGEEGKGIALLWDMTKLSGGKPALTIRDHSGWVNTVAFSPDSQWLATGDDNGDIRIQSLSDSESSPTVVSAHESWVTALAFSPDGQYLVSGSQDGTIRLWLILKNRLDENAFTFHGHEGPVWDLAFSPDQNWLASGSSDNTVRLWDLSTRSPDAVVLRGYGDIVTQVDFTADGRWLVTGSRDGTTRLWHMGLDHLRELACQIAGRNLTKTEWDQFITSEDGTIRYAEDGRTCSNYELVYEESDEFVSNPSPTFDIPTTGGGAEPPQACSVNADVPVNLTFTNNSDREAEVYWINYNCEAVFYGTLLPGDSYEQGTFETHPWVLIDVKTGEVLKEFVAGTVNEEVTIP